MARRSEVYTHGHHDSVLRAHRWRTAENSAGYLLAELRPGDDVLDVGCGPGTITADLARRVAPGRVVGIDNTAAVLAEARAVAARSGATNLSLVVGDAYRLVFADASFDIVHAHQLLQHLTDPVAALCEMRRVCRPGGLIAARDIDYAAMTWYPHEDGLARWVTLCRQVTQSNGAEPDAGRRLLAWAHAAGLTDVTPSADVWCYATPADRTWWGELWAERVTHSALAEQAVSRGLATRAELVLQGYIEGKHLVAGDAELASTQVKEGRPYIWPCSTR